MTTFTVDVRAAAVLGGLRNSEKRIGYAVVNAINDTAKLIQKEERRRVGRQFTVRKTDFVMRQAAVIKPFASVAEKRFEARIAVGQKPRLLLSQFEAGGERRPFTPGAQSVAVPITGTARPNRQSSVPAQLHVKALKLRRIARVGGRRRKKGERAPIEGLQGTYVVPSVGIFQRLGRQRSRILYAFKRGLRLDRRLGFVTTAEAVARRSFGFALGRQIADTIRRNFGR